MTNYALPVNDKDISKAKTFYDLICWGGLLIVLLPVGIANVILGYFMGDSPCTLCWGQRQEMAYIGVVALFMVRYGFKPKYLATMLVMAAVGLYMSFRHYGNHAMRDVGQGFGLDVFGIHTQFWAEIVFWCVVFLFGLAVYLALRRPRGRIQGQGLPSDDEVQPRRLRHRHGHHRLELLPGPLVHRRSSVLGPG